STESTTNQFQPESWQTEEETAIIQNGERINKSSLFSGSELGRTDSSLRSWIWYLAPKTICLVVLSLIYLGFSLLGIKMWSSSDDNV
ncbi:unnamed protein product, partial [Candidula unifasciata]